ncbi:radical SAM-linked protein/radical SAM family uncharacterized protein [Synechococcus sp. PCC 7502]|uniref:TIGR03960 family B12-binding radical SAM protein n=1 Tax=Synechococcus sp. PCC 7502 TaxID=1173263 RepID=UPI00029F8832|nr:TIGR03960 family B12-binding radical SAM protein [Synechococcus sp. PCC 7502]AFY72831.1 radical SAM-linked protein/radical SAM family uncharacterized protein [Synechococcus sp. PCC 7502]
MSAPISELITADILKPARYLGNELGAVHKPWELALVRWCLTYPEIYEVGASNLGHIILYSILNAQSGQLCDRSYLPAPDLALKLRETHTPLFAVESQRSLREFDILGFSLSYELGATNILEMLDLAHIPLTWQERNQEGNAIDHVPLIFAGGQTATSNPEPYADFFDFLALGDGEELLPEIGEVIKLGKLAEKSRLELLLDLAQVDGVYVPQFYRYQDGAVIPNRGDIPAKILRRVAAPMPEHSIGLVPLVETVHDRLTIEIRRGCTRGCRFCQPGMLTRPARDVKPEAVVSTIERAVKETGYNEFSLLSLSCSDYLALPSVGMEIKNRLKNQHISLSLPSQRVDRFDQNIANILKSEDGRQQGLTFAPEAGTQRLRDVINKGLTDEELLRGVKIAYEQGWNQVKLYFMIGLPTETDEDVIGIVDTIALLQEECRLPNRKILNVHLTISNFTPKPHTPFQWHQVSPEDFLRKQKLLKSEFRKLRGVKVNYTDVRISAMEDILGRGDRHLGKVIKTAWQLGAGMDAWFENAERAFGAWQQSLELAGLTWTSPDLNMDQVLPWDHIDTGIDKNWLKEDWQKAITAVTVPDCSFHGCSKCGVCSPDFGHNIVIPAPPIPEFLGNANQKASEPVQRIRITFGKLGKLALVSHLDLIRLLERSLRRAEIPMAFSQGFHPTPKFSLASALALGVTSSGKIADFELSETMDILEFRERLSSKLPADMPIYAVEQIDLKAISAERAITKAEYILTFNEIDRNVLDLAIAQIKDTTSILIPKTSKSGHEYMMEIRDRLYLLESIDGESLRYVGSQTPDGWILKPDQVMFMINQMITLNSSDALIKLTHIHRVSLS